MQPKSLYLYVLLLMPLLVIGQDDKEIGRYSNYSYLLIMMNGKDTLGNATGFFVESKCKKLYLVSNFHVLLNRTPSLQPLIKNGKIIKWDRILIRYKKRHTSLWSYYNLDLTQSLREASNFTKPWPVDLYRLEIKDLNVDDLNITDLQKTASYDTNIKIGTKAFIFGFPVEDYKKEKNYNKRTTRILSGVITRYENTNILTPTNMDLKLSCTGKEGFSGSPVFAYYYKREKSKKRLIVEFLGVNFASGGNNALNIHSIGFRDIILDMMIPPCK